MRYASRLLTLAAAAASATVLACSDSPNATPNPALSAAQAESIAAVVAVDLDALPDGATLTMGGMMPAAPSPGAVLACQPTVSPQPTVNSDADPVPDSMRIDFTGCVIERPMETVTRFGTMDIVDMQPLVAGHTVRARLTDFGRSVTRNDPPATWTVSHDGVRQFQATASTLQHEEIDFVTDYTFPDASTARHERDWSSTFAADVGQSISPMALPSGSWTVAGLSTWTKGDNSWSLAVTTLVPMHFDPACDVAPRFDDGTVQAVVTRGDQTSTVTIEFTACGQYTVTRS